MKRRFFIATILFIYNALAFGGGGGGGGSGSTAPFFGEHLLSVFAVAAIATWLIKNKP